MGEMDYLKPYLDEFKQEIKKLSKEAKKIL